MGIKNLFTFMELTGIAIEKYFFTVLEERRLAGKRPTRTVGIDMNNWIYARINAAHKRNSLNVRKHRNADYIPYNSEVTAAKWDVVTSIIGLLEIGITPICVFDGLAPYAKLSSVDALKDQRNIALASIHDKVQKIQTLDSSSSERQKLEQDVSRLKGKYLSCPMAAFHEIAEILGVLNVTCLWAKSEVQERAQHMSDRGMPHPIYVEDKEGIEGRSESDQILSALYPVHIDAIMSSDTDFPVMGCDIIIQRTVIKTVRDKNGKDIRTSLVHWTYIEADRVWDQFGFTLYPLVPRTSSIPIPSPEDEFICLNSVRADTVPIGTLRKSYGPQSMKQLKLLTHKMVLACAIASCPGVNMRKPTLAAAARAAEEGYNIPDTISYLDQQITKERNKRKCNRCFLPICNCEKYGSNKTIICTMLAYLTFTRLPYEYSWFRHVCKNRKKWLPDSVEENSWSLVSTEYIGGNIRDTKKVLIRIGSILPTNRIDIDLFERKLPTILPNMLSSQDMKSLLSEINNLNTNIAQGIYWNKIDQDLEEITMNNAVYAEHRLAKDFAMPIKKVAEAFEDLFEKQQQETTLKRSFKKHYLGSSSDASPYASSSPPVTSQDDIPELLLDNDPIITESFCSSLSSLADSTIPNHM